ncbi:tetratricopeptide repeat protein [Novosphingobium lentum]|uniref:tetratricopeptide repeat protein n=1 Tax=Novosphingobium lentum TaxID=145287 RepID=UPI001FE15351|nr:hypothetical protein [Novosphingobium lentum]
MKLLTDRCAGSARAQWQRAGHMRAGAAALALLVAGSPFAPLVPAARAQSAAVESPDNRLKRIESEVHALQRKVFPDGAGKTFAPEITGAAPSTLAPGTPSGTAVSDMLARMDAVEAQMARLTAQTEENQNRIAKLDARLSALEPTGASGSAGAPAAASSTPPANGSTLAANTAAMTGGASRPAAPAPAGGKTSPAPKPSPDRVAAVQAIEKPVSGDRGEDEYLYGYRLWEARFYPEAAQQLERTAQQFPKHKRISYVRNLIGRSYLDDGKPGTAAQWFLQNYQDDKKGDRAPDSLLYLGVAMTKLKETKRACVALQEMGTTYPQEVAGRLATQYARARSEVKCN